MAEDHSVYTPLRAPTSGWTWAFVALMAGTLLLMLFLVGTTVWGAATLRYTLTEEQLTIRYGYQLERIERAGITAAYQLEPTQGRRIGGTGLRRLKQGWFTFAETGRIKLYAASTRPLTVIEAGGGKWGISPAEPDALLTALAAGRTGTFEPVPGAFTFLNLGFFLIGVGVAGMLVPAGMIFLMLHLQRAPGAMTYTLDQDGIKVRVGWSRIRVPYRKIESVEIASPAGVPWRTLGAGMPGLYWGHFRWRQAGPNLRLYATRTKPLVLIRTATATYGLTPAEDARFVAEVKARLG